MPEHAAFAVGLGCDLCFFYCFPYREVLVVSRQNFECLCLLYGEADEILEDVQQPCFFEHALIEGVKLGVGCVFITAVFGLPLHEAIKARGDGTRLVCSQIANHANGVVIEDGGDVLHVIADLIVCVFCIHFILGRAF